MAFKLLTPENVKFIVVHCSASQPDPRTDVSTIDRWHRKRGFTKVGYHFVIKTDGTIQEGRKLTEIGAHVQGHNQHSLGICLVGGVDDEGVPADNFTVDQKEALRGLLLRLSHTYTMATILGHRDLSPDRNGDGRVTRNEWMKECPCFDVRAGLKDVEQTD